MEANNKETKKEVRKEVLERLERMKRILKGEKC
jgi:hypothetical protein